MSESTQKVAGVLYKFKLEDGTWYDRFVPGALGSIRIDGPGTMFTVRTKDGEETFFVYGATVDSYQANSTCEGPAGGTFSYYVDDVDIDVG